MNEPILETHRLRLRLTKESDLDDLLKIFSAPKVMAAFNEHPFTRQQMANWLKRNLSHQEQHGYGLCAVELKDEGALIGNCGLEHMEMDGIEIAELGYDFRSDYWNQGYATEAAAAVRDYAFNELSLPSLISLIRVGNRASQRVSEKTGMRFVEEIERNGIRYWKYAICNPQYQT